MHDIQEKLSVKNMSDLTIKAIKCFYNTKNLKKEQIKKIWKRNLAGLTWIYFREDLALSIILDCRIPTAIEFRSKLGFKQHDIIRTKEQSVLKKNNESICKWKNITATLSFRLWIDLYFPKHRLALESDEKGHKDRNENDEVKNENNMNNILIVNLLGLILMKKILICMLKLVKYTLTLLNQLNNNQKIVNGQDFRIKFDKIKSLLKNIAIVKYCYHFKNKQLQDNVMINIAVCSSEKWGFMKEKEPKGILSSLGLKTPLNKNPLCGDSFL